MLRVCWIKASSSRMCARCDSSPHIAYLSVCCHLSAGHTAQKLPQVPRLLSFLTHEMLKDLNLCYKIYVVSGVHFGCANVRERFVLVGFYEEEHLNAFIPPPVWTIMPTPIGTVLKSFSEYAGRSLLIKPQHLRYAANGDTTQTGARRKQSYVHVVSADCELCIASNNA